MLFYLNHLFIYLFINIRDQIKSYCMNKKNLNMNLINDHTCSDFDVKINCLDFTLDSNRIIYGTSNGLLRCINLNYESDEINILNEFNVKDRILRCVFSPSYK